MNVKGGLTWLVLCFLCMTSSGTEGVSSQPKQNLDHAAIRPKRSLHHPSIRPKRSLGYSILGPRGSLNHALLRPTQTLIRPKRNADIPKLRPKRSLKHSLIRPKRSLFRPKQSFDYVTIRRKRHLDATSRPKRSVGHPTNRRKRSLGQFGDMIELQTGIDRHLFNGYGNYCGLLGKGIPVDPVDSCCFEHDICYYFVNRAQCRGGFGLAAFTQKYTWLHNLLNKDITCEISGNSCSAALCRCDKMTAKCFNRTKHTYNPGWQRSFWGAVLKSRPVFTPG